MLLLGHVCLRGLAFSQRVGAIQSRSETLSGAERLNLFGRNPGRTVQTVCLRSSARAAKHPIKWTKGAFRLRDSACDVPNAARLLSSRSLAQRPQPLPARLPLTCPQKPHQKPKLRLQPRRRLLPLLLRVHPFQLGHQGSQDPPLRFAARCLALRRQFPVCSVRCLRAAQLGRLVWQLSAICLRRPPKPMRPILPLDLRLATRAPHHQRGEPKRVRTRICFPKR